MTQPKFGETPPEPRNPKRYLISIEAAQAQDPSRVHIHDTEHLQESCNTDDIAPRDRSYFGDLEWALNKGYQPCGHCLGNTVRLPQAEGKPLDHGNQRPGLSA